MSQDPEIFAEAIRRLRPPILYSLIDCIYTLGLHLEHKVPKPEIPPDQFCVNTKMSELELNLFDKLLHALMVDQSYLKEVNRLLEKDGFKFKRVVTTTTLVDI